MSTSHRAFDQVRSILGKLDRDIDAARQKRLQPRVTQPAPLTAAVAAAAAAIPGVAALATPRPVPGGSAFGRATPMRIDQRARPTP